MSGKSLRSQSVVPPIVPTRHSNHVRLWNSQGTGSVLERLHVAGNSGRTESDREKYIASLVLKATGGTGNVSQSTTTVTGDGKKAKCELDNASWNRHYSKVEPLPTTEKQKLTLELTKNLVQLYSIAQHNADDNRVLDLFLSLSSRTRNVDEQVLGGSSSSSSTSGLVSVFLALDVTEFCRQFCIRCLRKDEIVDQKLTAALGTMLNLTAVSPTICRRFTELHFEDELFELLTARDELDPAKTTFTTKHIKLIVCIVGILHNVIQAEPAVREVYRDKQALHVLQKFRTCTDDTVNFLAVLLQAFVVNEDENETAAWSQEAFNSLADELSSALSSEQHTSTLGFQATHVLTAFNKLAVNDANHWRIVASGVLSVYVRLLAEDCSVREQRLATAGLWTLARKRPEDVRDTEGCEEALEHLFATTTDDEIKLQTLGVFRELGVAVTKSDTPAAADVKTFNGTIFISYNHQSQATVHRIRDRLKSLGFSIWIDSEQKIHKANAIAEGLDKASAVIVCVAQAYYESPCCQDECTYAHDCNKEIIPLLMEPRYSPHGWLQLLLGGRHRHDFSDQEQFEDSMQKLVDYVRTINIDNTADVKQMDVATEIDHSNNAAAAAAAPADVNTESNAEKCPTRPPALTSSTSRHGNAPGSNLYSRETEGSSVHSWTTDDVRNWLHRNGLERLEDWFSEFDGRLLLEYKRLKRDAPETFLQQELQLGHLTFTDILRLNSALRQLV